MNALEVPQWLADNIEWRLLATQQEEVSRGDLKIEHAHSTSSQNQSLDLEIRLNQKILVDEKIDDCFDHLQYRALAFRKCYAFDIEDDVISKRRESSETDSRLIYRFLLACSQPELSKDLSPTFSALCKVALGAYLGKQATVWNVDAGSPERAALGGSTREVAIALARELGASVREDMLEELAPQGGDGGVDLVASFSFDDRAVGHAVILGQCAASRTTDYWRDKIYQPARFESLYNWTSRPLLATFIPVVYRTASGKWLNHINIGEVLLFDRLRICSALSKKRLDESLRISLTEAIQIAMRRSERKPRRSAKKVAKKSANLRHK